ncbi:MAG: stage II sporulation protein M, partial [Methanocorpusculum sp.]|nr:stage II sporulation protein M [Methanocorpusculum sp.]
MMSDRKIYVAALAVVVILFFGSCIYGYTASIQMPEAADEIVVTFQSSTTELDSSAPAQLSWQIFNNLRICLILFLGGMTFGAATLFVVVSNGYVIGSISGVMLRGYDVSV